MSLGDWLGIIGLVVGVVGLAVAIWQIVLARRAAEKSQSAAEAALEAVDRTQRLVTLVDLLILLPQMQRLQRDLQTAVTLDDKTRVLQFLADWQTTAPQAAGMLSEARATPTETLEKRLTESGQAAARTASDLGEDGRDLNSATKAVLTEIAGATQEAGLILGRLRASPASAAGGLPAAVPNTPGGTNG